MRNIVVTSGLLSFALLGCAGDGAATEAPNMTASNQPAPAAAASAPAPDAAPASPAHRLPVRDGKAHRWELRAFADNHVEVWMDSERVPEARIVREGNRVAVTNDAGTVIERLDLPANWTPEHGAAGAPGTYRTVEGTTLVPPAAMLGGKLEPVPASTLAHLHAAHTAADGSRCTYVASVIPGLPMDAAGVRAHDVIVAVNGNADASPTAVRAAVRAAKPGDTVTLTLVRAGERRDAAVVLAAWDPKHMVNPVGKPAQVAPAMASSAAPAGAAAAPAPAGGQADALQQQVVQLKAQVADLERQQQAEDAVRKAIRPQPAPQPSAK